MGYANISFRLTDEEKEAIREIAEERGITMSRLCGEIMRENCLDCEVPGRQTLSEDDLLAIAEVIRDEINLGGNGGGGELPQSEKLEDYVSTAAEATKLSRSEIIARLLSYAIKHVSAKPDMLFTSIDGVKNTLNNLLWIKERSFRN